MTKPERDALESKVKKFDELQQMRHEVGRLLAVCGTKPATSPGTEEIPDALTIKFGKWVGYVGGSHVSCDETIALGRCAEDETAGVLWLIVGAIRGGLLRAAEALDRRLLDMRPDLDALTVAEHEEPPAPPAGKVDLAF